MGVEGQSGRWYRGGRVEVAPERICRSASRLVQTLCTVNTQRYASVEKTCWQPRLHRYPTHTRRCPPRIPRILASTHSGFSSLGLSQSTRWESVRHDKDAS